MTTTDTTRPWATWWSSPLLLPLSLGALILGGCDESVARRSDGSAEAGGPLGDGPLHEAAVRDRGVPTDTGVLCPGDELAPWAGGPAYYARWTSGPSSAHDTFPVAVWLQDPAQNAEAYKAIGINIFIGLWKGPTEAQLEALAQAQLPVIAHQNDTGLTSANTSQIWAWMHQDEPDNAQAAEGGGYDPCVEPSEIQAGYAAMVAKDATRPVYLNFGRGVAQEEWGGRGVCTGHLEHYPEYIKGADIISFDIYPVTSTDLAAGNLWYVPRGVERLREYAEYNKPVWTWIETTSISNEAARPTAAQIRTEVWMALIHGAMGVGYFAHEFKPEFKEAGLLAYPEISQGVAAINAQITELAPVLNSPPVANGVSVTSSDSEVPVATLLKRHNGATYLFAVAMRDAPTSATFALTCAPPDARVEVLGEQRQLDLAGGSFSDEFDGYGVHLYHIVHTLER